MLQGFAGQARSLQHTPGNNSCAGQVPAVEPVDNVPAAVLLLLQSQVQGTGDQVRHAVLLLVRVCMRSG